MKWLFLLNMVFLIACQTKQKQHKPNEERVKVDSILQAKKDSIERNEQRQKALAKTDSIAAIVKTKPVWGARKTIAGDFDGDGTQDTLFEKYISPLTGKETNKSYDFEGFGDGSDYLFYWQKWIGEKQIMLKLLSKKPGIKSFLVDTLGMHDGFLYLKNVGDLNQDGTDELAYCLNYIDFSNSTSAYLATYKNGKWKKVHHWIITEHDFQYTEGESKPDPTYIRQRNGKVYCREMDDDYGGYQWKPLKINW